MTSGGDLAQVVVQVLDLRSARPRGEEGHEHGDGARVQQEHERGEVGSSQTLETQDNKKVLQAEIKLIFNLRRIKF